MPFGILEDRYLDNVPGTALLEDLRRKDDIADVAGFKHGTGRDSHIVLVPQPSDDPRDPLNWPTAKKEACFCCSNPRSGAIGPILTPGYNLIAVQWNVSVNTVAAANGYAVVSLAIAMMIMAPFAVKYGRRPVFIVSALMLFLCSIWTATEHGLSSFIASRVFHGAGMASFEALMTATIADMYFVASASAPYILGLWLNLPTASTGRRVSPPVNGFVIASAELGWRWAFWLISIAFGIALVLIILFVPETTVRAPPLPHAKAAVRGDAASGEESEKKLAEPTLEAASVTQDYLPPKTFIQELAPWSGYLNSAGLFEVFWRPFPFALSPAIIFAEFTYGLTTVWLVILSTVSSFVFGGPPYFFDPTQVGLVSIGPLIATIISVIIGGPLCDWSATAFAKRNKGIYEPEARLVLMIPMLVLQVVGYAGWAAMQSHDVHWIGPVIMYSLVNAGQSIGSTAIQAYVIDVHRKSTPECFALVNFVKNMILFGFTQFAVNWVQAMGILHTFGMLAGLTALCILTTVPMYVYGKRCRSWVARHPALFRVS
ncbi:putative cycloheximide resistance protein [Auricularia subglabra TFB-10046 SS5]|uniref:Putative cycloheximide resistance protein n=1 Tax=Auricularia subglabra (strain TFB-10046 / SS5) TaxID=717982 RepID=J0WX53_AURST|nr:putative cycloheximide resistance protein [Auricularia subglabra TFB-10046 SS5]